jgi:nanoRNase/pAp phosphatase (c-di-AMP/oligoRNAs hydrolase)
MEQVNCMSEQTSQMRLLTRSDFDGLACAVLLKEIGLISSYKFVHPKDMQDGKIEVTSNDVLANVPYVPGCGLWFDHHLSEQKRVSNVTQFEGSFKEAPSCARVIWDYYGGHEKFGTHLDAMMAAVDKCDSAQLDVDDIENPQDWILLSFVMDSRTGLGRYRDYRISNYQLMEEMVEHCRTKSIDEIIALPDVQERLVRYHEQTALFREMIRTHATQRGNVVVVDLRDQEEIFAGNRFVLYTMFPEANISAQIMWGFQKQNIVITCGHSITNRTSKTDVGSLMLHYGGGGHRAVGTCQVAVEKADEVLEEIVARMNQDG